MRYLILLMGLWAALIPPIAAGQALLELVQATYFGTAGDDDVQGAAGGPDGSIYIVGNTGRPLDKLPGGAVPVRLGRDAADARCGHGFVARLSPDGGKVLDYAEFAAGLVSLTTVQANDRGVYVGGYATAELEPLLEKVPGLVRRYPLREQVAKLGAVALPRSGQLEKHGAPCVLRLTADLKQLDCGTYLEGWQQVWAKDRVISTKPTWKCWPTEYTWQATHIGLLSSGDVVVCHDGGYVREATEADRKLAAAETSPAASQKMLERLTFYDVCDHLSRLSPDLARRQWRQDIYTPAMNLQTLRKYRQNWPVAHYSNPRTHRMRLDAEENIYVCGWSASATSREPWWSPYLWKLRSSDGSLVQRIRETDPMSGKDDRMGGAVADAAITTLALEPAGSIVYSRISDGGYRGVIHFSGSIRRMDGQSLEDVASVKTIPCVWTTDMAPISDGALLAVGRCNGVHGEVAWTADAWQRGDPQINPAAWLRVYNPKLEMTFSTAIDGVVPFALVPLSERRFIVVGQSRGTLERATRRQDQSYAVAAEPNPGLAPTKNALFASPAGGSDGYWMIVDYAGAKGP